MPLGGALTIGAAAVSAGAAVGKFLHSTKDLKNAKAEEGRLKTPFFKVQDEYLQNRDLAAQQASQGLNSATKNYLTTETGRGFTAGIGAIQEGGGDVNQVAKLFDTYQQGIGKTAAEDASMHVNNLQQYLERNVAVAGQKNMAFSINELQPYERKLKQLQQRKAADIQGQFSAVSDFAGSMAAGGTAISNMNLNNAKIAGEIINPTSAFGKTDAVKTDAVKTDANYGVYSPKDYLSSPNDYISPSSGSDFTGQN